MLPSERQRIIERLSKIAGRLDRLLQSTVKLAKALSYKLYPSIPQIDMLARMASHLAAAPAADAAAVANDVWNTSGPSVLALIEQGQIHADRRRRLADVVEDDAWSRNVAPVRKQFVLRGHSWFRWLSGSYRQAVRDLESLCVGCPPPLLEEKLALLDDLLAGQKAHTHIEQDSRTANVGQQAFGSLWQSVDSDWAKLKAVADWVSQGKEKKLPESFRQLLSAAQQFEQCGRYAESLLADLPVFHDELVAVFTELKLDLRAALGSDDLNSVSLVDVKKRIELWLQNPSLLETWIAFRTRWRRLLSEQLDELASLIDAGNIKGGSVCDQFYMATYEEIMRAVYRHFPHLAEFDGQSHEEVVARFQRLDRQRIEFARREVAVSHFRSLPRGDSEIGEMVIVRHEIQKKSRHLPIRKLIAKAEGPFRL